MKRQCVSVRARVRIIEMYGDAGELTARESDCVGMCPYWVERWRREGKKEGRVEESNHSTVQTQEEAERTDGNGGCGRGFGTDLV